MAVNVAGWQIPSGLTPAVTNYLQATQRQENEQAGTIGLQQEQAQSQYQDTIANLDAQAEVLEIERQQLGQRFSDARESLAAEQEVLDVQLSHINPRYRDEMGLINEQQARLDLQRAQLEPAFADQQMVFDAQQALNTAQSREYQLRGQQLQARQQEFEQLTTALDDVENQINVARGQQRRATYDQRYEMAGLPTPTEVNRPLEGDAPGLDATPGVRYGIETDADRLQRQFARNQQERGLVMEGAQLGTARAGLNVDETQLERARADAQRQLALDRAGLDVTQAGIGLRTGNLERGRELDRAQLGAQQAGINLQRGDLQRDRQLGQAQLGQRGVDLSGRRSGAERARNLSVQRLNQRSANMGTGLAENALYEQLYGVAPGTAPLLGLGG